MKKGNLRFAVCGMVMLLNILFNLVARSQTRPDPEYFFRNPPESAKPGILWMWMGSNVSKAGITKDLEALKKEGFSLAMLASLADINTPWNGTIAGSPTPEIVAWTEPWWKLVEFAMSEAKRLNIKIALYNCPGYTSSGGPWIKPEQSMQEVCWSTRQIEGNGRLSIRLDKPVVDPHANMRFPSYDPVTGKLENLLIEARKSYYKDISVLAMPATGTVAKDSIIDLSAKMDTDGNLDWHAPPGKWMIYRFGHTTTGAVIQPAQPRATGLECDKMDPEAVSFQTDHMLSEIKKHVGKYVGNTLTGIFYDSYEIDPVTWTPKMREVFSKYTGYDIVPYLATFAGRTIGSREDSIKFRYDFERVTEALFRDVYFKTVAAKLKAAGLDYFSEAYGGPWRLDEITPQVSDPMCEFWTDDGKFTSYMTESVIAAIRKTGKNVIMAEAFTGQPVSSKWDEYPAWLKPVGDKAFCEGINRFVIHRFTHQPWDSKYLPGASMGQWGTHFDRTQTWWKAAKATVTYWQRCSALLQMGIPVKSDSDLVVLEEPEGLKIDYAHRKAENTDIFFIANTAHTSGYAYCRFQVSGRQPELWNPVTGEIRDLPNFEDNGTHTQIALNFEDAESYFVVFRKKYERSGGLAGSNFKVLKPLQALTGNWQVRFDPAWGGPKEPIVFEGLQDWTKSADKKIKYFSGTAVYNISFDVPESEISHELYVDLGEVKHIAHVYLNKKDLGVVWTAPWGVTIPKALIKTKGNVLTVEVTNVWANRLIGDEQDPDDCEWSPNGYFYNSGKFLKAFPDWFLNNQPRPSKGRYGFTTWNYFSKDAPLIPSGLIGPVRLMNGG
ncbi:hypothetical protein FO440_18115 [Mucilaginibacter corticis]|uniref:Glycosyl hydrolases family 2 sugar binding domain-containing protein n=1 Tax=Mucilaginibacter corticis TaxID=2597670 RepID=A0A556MIC2_9SPHI|nr:glycosyl hydrolase [Mucilaginibacter corticis]TSJ39657.1 hypothetical protein FO440_18115 [Mucilaginibacter corticis]